MRGPKERKVCVRATKENVRRLGSPACCNPSSGRLREREGEGREEEGKHPETAEHTQERRKRELGNYLLRWSSDCLNTSRLDYRTSPL